MKPDEMMRLARVVAISHGIHGDEGCDVESEILLKLLTKRGGDTNPASYAAVTARNTAIDHIRAARKHVALEDAPEPPSDPWRSVDLAIYVEQVLGALDEREQAIVTLRAQGLQFKEIGLALGIHPNHAKSISLRLQKRMNRLFGENQ